MLILLKASNFNMISPLPKALISSPNCSLKMIFSSVSGDNLNFMFKFTPVKSILSLISSANGSFLETK